MVGIFFSSLYPFWKLASEYGGIQRVIFTIRFIPRLGIVNLTNIEHRTGNSPCCHSLIFQNSVDGLYAGMKASLPQVDNTL